MENAATESTTAAPTTKKARSWRLLAPLAVLAVVVWLLPSIVAHSPLLQWGVNMATAKMNGSVTIGSASLGWFSSIDARNIEVKDVEGKPVATVAGANVGRSLIGLLINSSNLGKIRLESPKLSLVLRDDGSNVEDVLAKYLVTDEKTPPSSTKLGLSVEVIDATLSVTDQHLRRSWEVQKVGATFEMMDGADGPMAGSVSADLLDAKYPGKITASMKTATGGSEAKIRIVGLPVAMFRALAERFSPGTKCDGRLSSEVTVAWGGPGGKNSVKADVSTDAFLLGTPMLQTDVVELDRFRAVCQVSWQADRVEIEQSSIDCDLGNVSLSSTVKRDAKTDMSFGSLLRQRHELSGRIDLARAARVLPATLRLRRQVAVDSGQVQLALSSRPEQQGMVWHGQLNMDNLTATASGRKIAWQQPLSMVADAHETSGGPVVDNLRCESDFLKVQARGTPDALAASLSFDLQRLSDQLGQFVDLGKVQLAGRGLGDLHWKRTPQQQFDADAEIRLTNFQVGLPNQPAWREDDLVATFAAKGQTNLDVDTRIDSASVSVKSQTDQIDVRLMQPVKDLRNGGAWPVRVQAQGQLQNWPGRLAAWVPTKDCRLTGAYTLAVDGTMAKESVELRQIGLAAAPMIVASPWVNINEPRVDVALAGSWDQAKRRLRIEPGTLKCATVAMQANNVTVALPENGAMEMTGSLSYQGDVARLRQWISDPAKPSAWRAAGQLGGTLQLNQADGVIRGDTTTDVANLAVIDATGQQFLEPRVRLVARGDYNTKAGVMQFEKVELTSSAVAAGVTGRVNKASGVNSADINAQLGYDLERVAALLRPYFGPGLRVVGRGSSAGWYRGPFSLATGQAAGDLRWDSANVYGFQVGAGQLKATMGNGLLQLEPLDLAVSQGRMHLAPGIRLSSDPMVLTLPKGPVAQQIQIDPALCESMMQYVAPAAAGVATAKGAFSIDVDGCQIPVSDPKHGEMAGRFTFHSMVFGPGPLVRSLSTFLKSETPVRVRENSVVQFRMVDGRVYHQGLELIFPDVTVRTYGSVGLDQTMAIMAEMPVPPKWTEKNPLAADAMRGQVLRIPIAGTLSKPQLDQKVMEGLTRQFMQKAATNMIEGEVNRQLDRLFGPKK
jgi:hypothetical protein